MLGKRLALLILTTAVIGAGCGMSRPAPMPAPKGVTNRTVRTTPTPKTHRMTPIHKTPKTHKARPTHKTLRPAPKHRP